MPSVSTRLTVTFLYSFPVVVLKSSASASRGGFCRFCFPQRNDKIIVSHTQSLCASHSEAATVCREVELRVRACRFRIPNAGVAELADALDSKSSGRKAVWVRAPPPAVLTGCWTLGVGRSLFKDTNKRSVAIN